MAHLRRLEKEPNKNWDKVIMAFDCIQKQLERFIDKEMVIFHGELVKECGANPCVKNCHFKKWDPRKDQIPPLGCELCSSWRDSILANHTNPKGNVMWKNSKPDRWSQDKWEVAKVYMPGGHEKHNSIGDFDIAALLCLMSQCKHFKKFKLHQGLCQNVSEVRNNIMHSATFQLKQKDFLNYFNRIRKFGEVLEKRDPEFESLSKEINENLVSPDDMAAQKIRAQNEKELEDIIFDLTTLTIAFVRAKHCLSQKYMSDIVAGAQQYSLLDNLWKQIEGVLKKHSGNTSGEEMSVCSDAEPNTESSSLPDHMDYYPLIHNPRGLCVVINNEDFPGPGLKSRKGTQKDVVDLSKVFTRLGFTVLVHNNLTAEAMRQELQKLGSRNFLDDDVLVVCVLSHGELECVFGTDEQKVYLQELTRPFTSREAPTLAGKPKLFFIQACQGNSYQRGAVPCPPRPRQEEVVRQSLEGDVRQTQEEVVRQSPLQADAGIVHRETVSWDADILLGMATVPECKAFRNVNTGSIYIQQLCKQLRRSAESSERDDILSVLTRVNGEVGKGEYLNYKQMPQPKYTLTKKLVLKFV